MEHSCLGDVVAKVIAKVVAKVVEEGKGEEVPDVNRSSLVGHHRHRRIRQRRHPKHMVDWKSL